MQLEIGALPSLNLKRENGKEYTIVKTEYGKDWHHTQAIDHIQSKETGKIVEMTRNKTLNFFGL